MSIQQELRPSKGHCKNGRFL